MTECKKASQAVLLLLLLLMSLFVSACTNNPQVANTNTGSAGPSEPPAYEGYHDITNCNAITGWAWDMNRPNDPVKIDLYDGDRKMATVTADAFRQDLLDAKKGNGKHGFSYPTPPQLKDEKPHMIKMKFAGTEVELQFTNKVINCRLDEVS
ncbi:MAG: hypothetical protein AABN95_16765 [Acidobacteriota bacterium]